MSTFFKKQGSLDMRILLPDDNFIYGKQDLLNTLQLSSILPLKIFDADSIMLLDTSFVKIKDYAISIDSSRKKISIDYKWPSNQPFNLVVFKNGLSDSSGLKLFKNEHRLGPFMNKLRACSYAKNEWIALIDSDNFADEDYFMTSKKYIETNIQQHEKNVILSPIPNIPDPNLHFLILEGIIYKRGSFPRSDYFEYTILMNLGNYVINKYLIDHLDISNETRNIQNSSTCDVIFMNTLLFEQLDLNFHVVPELKYTHVIHDLSIYKQLGDIYKDFNECIRQRHFRFITG
jgi:hypothetical protein